MTCAKRIVTCTIIGLDNRKYVGRNDCAKPQTVCPREKGEGYEKCKTICQQEAHAEIMALRVAGDNAKGGVAYIRGITHTCRACQEALFGAGVKFLRIL